MLPAYVIGMLVLALFTGTMAAFFGIGGGSIIVPALVILFMFDPKVAVGTSAVCVAFTAISSSISHHRFGKVDWDLGTKIAMGAVPGAFIGAALTAYIPSEFLLVLLSVMLIFSGMKLITSGERKERDMHRKLAFFIGISEGIIAGMLGIGGGIILVPALLFLGVSPHRAVATSSLVIVFTATMSALTHTYLAHVDFLAAGIIILGVIPGARFGAAMAHRTKAEHLRALLGIFLIVMAAIILFDIVF